MGIKKLLDVEIDGKKIRTMCKQVKPSELKGKIVAIDALNIIYRNIRCMREPLRNSKGVVTSHIYITIRQIHFFRKCDAKQVWIFDSGKPIAMKERRTNSISSNQINEVKALLIAAGIPYLQVDPGIEAEFYAAAMYRSGMCHYIFSWDTDVIAVGAMQLKKEKSKWYSYNGLEIIKKSGLSKVQFMQMCIHLGSDFTTKTKGVGAKTAVKKADTPLNDEQKKAFDYMTKPIKFKSFQLPKYNKARLTQILSDAEITSFEKYLI
jgi:5'-3' exonuclease